MAESNRSAEAPASQTAQDFIASQLELEADAREALPYHFDTCTKPLGPLRQSLYSCLTCNPPLNEPSTSYTPAGVCYSCSISCHVEHELVELFSRRDFECDCGTTRLPSTSPCSLRPNAETGQKGGVHSENPRPENRYNQNFYNRFCGCTEVYDPHKQEGTMFQCIGLGTTEDGGCGEDWWHPECVLGISKEWRKEKKTDSTNIDTTGLKGENSTDTPNPTENGTLLEASVSNASETQDTLNRDDEQEELPPGFPAEDDFEHFVCYICVAAFPWIKRYAGTPGFLPAIEHKSSGISDQDVIRVNLQEHAGNSSKPEHETPTISERANSKKRSIDETEIDDEVIGQVVKRTKEEEGKSATKTTDCKYSILPAPSPARVSLFLTDDFREHMCRCASCFPKLQAHPPLLEEEEVYEPPRSDSEADADEDTRSAGSRSLLDRGEAALSNMDRVRAIEGVMAYNHLRDKVKGFLKPFADSGQAVGAEDVKKYFEKLRGDEQAMREAAMAGGDARGDGDNRREQSGY